MQSHGSEFRIINLKQGQIDNPLLVLADFFNDDWLPGHLERLKEWRRCVISNGYFKGDKGSPAELLYFHKLNIELVGAMALLKDSQNSIGEQLFHEQLFIEKETWRDFPHVLQDEFLLNPKLFVIKFFDDYTLLQYRETLYEWLEFGLSLKAAQEFIDTTVLINVYENLQTLYNVAWLIHQRTSDKPHLKHKTEQSVEKLIEKRPVTLYKLNREIDSEKQALLSQVVSIIKHKVPTTEAIIYLGINPVADSRHYLVVLTANDEKETAQGLGSCIEESCARITGVVALVHHISKVINPDKADNRFYSHILECPVLYLSGNTYLPSRENSRLKSIIQSDIALWKRWNKQGMAFFRGAEFYQNIGADEAALFSLHQCTECLLIAIIRLVLGYRLNNHNLKKLLDVTQMFTNDIYKLFNLDDHSCLQDFKVLQHAYVNVRYKDIYEVDPNKVDDLYPKVCELVKLTENLSNHFVAANTL